ncbi:hypothetical protein BCS96_18660 [Vibrio breoganii]|uniref:hypothetical protein n=1 Tax=Vibrio breoganii TaxID=553239 RepID=UPI000C82FF4E|nr:hypothetical protein [Vibrio breoganii]PMG34619.1 hypothetical protein BCU93_18295 [Vibrio breoganii]PMG88227.1 hypothetical protein BCU81_09635 [Vibrio breoganii]PML87352.1 hypothetical protein BCT68_19060 [Vibrio breoganii]PMM51366.1 hypothetical protein BCT52_17690 [Vibrio breoganii]PMP03077.1 hypothetical protein BCS96_18660 [Vibrio breoganii]
MAKETQHNQKRRQQRGITPEALEILIAIGVDVHVDNEACHLAVSKKDQKRLLRTLKRLCTIFEKQPYTVLSHDGVVITSAYKTH